MSVSNGQAANQTTFNGAFLSRTVDSDTVAIIGLKNTDPASGSNINNTQGYINQLADADGVAGFNDSARKDYSSNKVVSDGDSRKAAIEKLDAKFSGTGGHTHSGSDGQGDLIPSSSISDILQFPKWTKYTFSHTALQTAALTNNIELFQLGIKEMIHQVVIKQSASFTGGAISAYSLSVGISGNLDKYASAFDVFQAPGNQVFQQSADNGLENMGAVTSIKLSAIAVGDNLNQSTTGSVDVYVLKSTLP